MNYGESIIFHCLNTFKPRQFRGLSHPQSAAAQQLRLFPSMGWMRCPWHTRRRRQLTPPKVRVLQTILWVVSTGRNIIFLDLFYLDIFYSLRIFNHTYCREKHPFNLKLFFWGALPAINQLLEVDPKRLGCRGNLGPWGWLLQVIAGCSIDD